MNKSIFGSWIFLVFRGFLFKSLILDNYIYIYNDKKIITYWKMICYTFTLDFSREIFLLCFDKIKDIILMNSTFAKKKQKKTLIFSSWVIRIIISIKKQNKKIPCHFKNVLKILFKERKNRLHWKIVHYDC